MNVHLFLLYPFHNVLHILNNNIFRLAKDHYLQYILFRIFHHLLDLILLIRNSDSLCMFLLHCFLR